jgi:hypothetical protein
LVADIAFIALGLCLLCLPAWGAQQRQMCLSCHPSHYTERSVCTGCHRGNPGSDRKNIAHHRLIAGRFAGFTLGETVMVQEGKRLMGQLACRRCHISGGLGNRLATSLDTLMDAKSPEEIAAAISSPALGMPDFRLQEKQVVALVNAVFFGAKAAGKHMERPLMVHFEAGRKGNEDVLSRKCGQCHRALSSGRGVIGSGDRGPNLSGLFTEYYPKTFGKGQGWSEERLRRWLVNPRMVRKWARMPPVKLSAKELRELVDLLMVRK